jgi:hypothetical protein
MGTNQEPDSDEAQQPGSTEGMGSMPQTQTQGLAALGPSRSQNRHGCADLPDADEKDHSQEENSDPFEVSFDGEDDPMCPRSSE